MAEQDIRKDIKDLHTKTDSLFEHVEDLHEKFDGLEQKVDRMEKDIDELKEGQKRHEKQLDRVMDGIDYLVGAMQDRKDEETAGTYLIGEHTKQLDNHEGRIQRLEVNASA